jgi:hypothetical protein
MPHEKAALKRPQSKSWRAVLMYRATTTRNHAPLRGFILLFRVFGVFCGFSISGFQTASLRATSPLLLHFACSCSGVLV